MNAAPARDSRPGLANRTQLPDEVAAYVRELIISGQVRSGEFLRIERIAEAVGVSQTPVREGLLALKSEGLINLLPRRGFVVASFTPQDIRDLYWAQAQVAGELAARAAENISDELLKVLTENVREYARTVESDDWERLPEIGLNFHRVLNGAAQSQRLESIHDSITANFPTRHYAGTNPKHTNAEHPRMLRALRKGDKAAVRKLMVDHITGQGARLVQVLSDRGLWADSAQDDDGSDETLISAS